MNPSTTKALSEALAQLHSLYPQWRYGQLVSNVAAWAGKDGPVEVWDVDDEAMLAAALAHLRRPSAATAPSVGGDRRVG